VISLRAKELNELDDDQLVARLADTRKELFNIRFQSATGALENTTRLKLARREIARILTIQNERGANVAGAKS
jgi:large subunit ribosomal protein L29